MILYFERKADKDEQRRMEVTVEEFQVKAGLRYLQTHFWRIGAQEARVELPFSDREVCIRNAILVFDERKAEMWSEEQ